MKKNSKSAKTVSSPATTENPSNTSSASEAEDIRTKKILARIGRRQNGEWKQSNDDRQWW
jgi:hypothetical protein